MFRILTLVLLFLIKIRFPKIKGFIEVLKDRYGLDSVRNYRKLERIDLKLKKASLDLEFLETCKKYETIPKFLYFKTYNRKFNSTLLYKSFQFKLLDFEINSKVRKN